MLCTSFILFAFDSLVLGGSKHVGRVWNLRKGGKEGGELLFCPSLLLGPY